MGCMLADRVAKSGIVFYLDVCEDRASSTAA